MIVILDLKISNVGSVLNMLQRIGVDAIVSSRVENIASAEKLILPGIGTFDAGMEHLENLGLVDVLKHKVVLERVPILGICLGMQLLTRESEEGSLQGLGLVDAKTVKFDFNGLDKKHPLPHMGWNEVRPQKNTGFFLPIEENIRFYFLHSYHVVCFREEDILGKTNYGYDFVSAFKKDNIVGVQFHPEKSHLFGLNFFRHFAVQ